MIYLEIAYAQKNEAKPFGVRWDPKEKLWYFPGDVLPEELERFRPAKAREGPVEKIILDIPFGYRDIAAKAGARWDSQNKAYLFEKRSGQALPLELDGFEPKQIQLGREDPKGAERRNVRKRSSAENDYTEAPPACGC